MVLRGVLLALLPGACLGFAPPVTPRAVRSDSSAWNHAATTSSTGFGGSAVQQQHALARSRTPGQGVRDGHGLSMAAGGPVLVEEKISADEAIALIGKAKTIVEADMGAKVPAMLSPDFRFLWQFNGDMSMTDYLTEGKGPYATLRTALPDLFWNSYDYRVDKYNRNRVWATTRLSGTHNGPLVFDGKEYPPTGQRVEAAPECVSIVFDESSGLATKITGGFCIDRGIGNTGPAGGIWGVLQAIGEPVAAWNYFPPVKVLVDVVGPTFRPKKSPGKAKSPYREPVAIALAKQVLTAGRDDPDTLADLLAEDCMIYAPILGPLKKKSFVQSATVDLADFFAGLDSNDNFHDARVDPFEPSRVWITSTPVIKVVGPLTSFGATFEPKRDAFVGTPQTMSVTFDSDGYASKITLGCPMDTEVGESEGLTNFLGVMAGLGIPLPGAFARPAPESFRKLVASVLPAPKPASKKPAPKPAAKKPDASAAAAPAKPAAAPKKAPVAAPKKKPAPPAKKPAPPAAKKAAPPAPKKAAATAPPKPAAKKAAATMMPKMPALKGKAAPKQKTAPKPAAANKGPAKPKAAPAPAPKAAPKPKMAPPKPKAPPARKAAPGKGKDAAAASAPEPAAAKSGGGGSPFGGLFNFGGSGGGAKKESVEAEKAAPGEKKAAAAPKKAAAAAPKQAAPAKKAKPAPAAPKAPAAGGVTFSPALTQKLEESLGSSARVEQLSKRTELFAKGGISAMDYWSTLKKTLGPDGAQNLGPDIIGALPAGNQKSALFKIFSTG